MSNVYTLRVIMPSLRKQWWAMDKAQAVGSSSRLCETWLYPFSAPGPCPGCSPPLRLIFLVCRRGEVKKESGDCFLQAEPHSSECTLTRCVPIASLSCEGGSRQAADPIQHYSQHHRCLQEASTPTCLSSTLHMALWTRGIPYASSLR